MVAEVRVHDHDEVAGYELQTVHVCGAETELAGAGFQDDVRGVGFHELLGYDLGSVWRAVVDDYEFPVELATEEVRLVCCFAQ